MLLKQNDLLSKYANDIIVLVDHDDHARIIGANDRAVSVYGYTRDALLRMTVRDLRGPDAAGDVEAQLRQVRAQDGFIFETLHRRKDGTTFPVEVSSRIIEASGRRLYQEIIRDITERKKAEAAIIQEKNKSDAIIAAIGAGITIRDRDFRIIYQNQIHKAEFGDHTGEYCYQAIHNRDSLCDECPVAISFQDGGVHTVERAITTDGVARFFEITSSPLRDETNRIVAGIEVVRDITKRKMTEESLTTRNRFIESVLDNLPIGLAVNRISDGAAIYMNPKFEETYGWPRTLITGVEEFFRKLYPDPQYRKEIRKRVLDDIAGGDPSRMRWEGIEITTQAGEKKLVTAVNIPLTEQNIMISTVQDSTGQLRTEWALQDSERRYKRLVESVTDYIYTVEVDNGKATATTHGPGCVNVTGYTTEEYQADPNLWYRMIFHEDRDAIVAQADRILSGAQVPPFDHRIIHKDGSIRWVRNTPVARFGKDGALIAYDGLITDITQLKLLENQLRQAQKMEAVGQLAGGIAHDFNNILTAVIGYGNLLLMKLPKEEASRSFVEQILSSAERAAHLTNSLLAFSRKQIIDLKTVNLHDIILRVEKLLTRVIGEDIEFKTALASSELIVLADSIQIEQILMNLATNARDAMPNGGSLTIETEPVELGEEYIRAHSYGKPGRYACISVSDTGTGMDERTRNRIFEPFFTTKEVGKGTGLGLSMVYGIVKQHNGYINVMSEPGKGTCFKMYFPLTGSSITETKPDLPNNIARGAETILVAEDDGSVRALTRNVLEDFGYTVIEAADGQDALKKFYENRDRIDLLLFDIIMPRKNGKEAYQEILKARPGIKALFTSGYTAEIVHKKGILDTGLEFVLKPIAPADLLKKVREVLDKK